MNEIKKIHLGRQPFTISVEAHRALRTYLDAIEHQVGVNGDDVLKEVELRMAELLAERGIVGDKVVLAEDVDFLQEQLGKPGDFKEESSENADSSDSGTTGRAASGTDADGIRRLYRDTDNAMIAGVASGLAAYFHVDALIIRLLFVVLTLTGGAGILMYILLWVLVPEAKSPSERLQMRGKAVTVDNIKKFVDRADVPAAAGRVVKTTGRIIRTIAHVLRIVIGVTIVTLATALFTAAMISGAYLLIQGVKVAGTDFFPMGAQENTLVITALIVVVILALALLFAGSALIRRKWTLPSWIVAAGIGLMITAASFAAVIAIDVVPRVKQRYDKQWITTSEQVAPFSEIHVVGRDTSVFYKQSSEYKIEVQSFGQKDATVNKLVKHDVTGTTLNLSSEEFNKITDCSGICLHNYNKLHIIVSAPDISAIDIKGDATYFEARYLPEGRNLLIHAEQGAQVNIYGNDTARVTVSNVDGVHQLLLEGLRPALDQTWPSIGVSPEYGVSLSHADEVYLKTADGEVCGDGMRLLYLSSPTLPRVMQINGIPISSVAALREAQNNEGRNVFNCLDVNTSQQ